MVEVGLTAHLIELLCNKQGTCLLTADKCSRLTSISILHPITAFEGVAGKKTKIIVDIYLVCFYIRIMLWVTLEEGSNSCRGIEEL